MVCPQLHTSSYSGCGRLLVLLWIRILESISLYYLAHLYSRLMSRIRTLLTGGERCVLLAVQTRRASKCCRPTLGSDRWLKVIPTDRRCSKESSNILLFRYQVTLGGGRPVLIRNIKKLTGNSQCVGNSTTHPQSLRRLRQRPYPRCRVQWAFSVHCVFHQELQVVEAVLLASSYLLVDNKNQFYPFNSYRLP